MATHHDYHSYKRDTRCLLYWVIHASNFVIKTNRKSDHRWKSPVRFNTSGTVTVDEFTGMTRLIGEEMRSVPSLVLGLLRSVILARTAHWDGFQQYTEGDPQVEKSFASDRVFTIALYKAFEAFEALCTNSRCAGQQSGNGSQVAGAIEEIILDSNFSVRDIRRLHDTGSESGSSDDVFKTQKRVKKRSNVGNKGKKKKKAKTTAQVFPGEVTLAKVPLNDYRFLRTDDEQMTEYAMAVCSYFRECYSLRAYLQGIWREVAYDGLNIVVAGTLVQLAIGMVKKAESGVLADFPGQLSFEKLERAITLGNVEKAQDEFGAAMHLLISDDQSQGSDNASPDLREYIMSYTCRDLVDFVVDYQQERNGQATREERLKWRRAYTINWLYDFVNIYSSPTDKRADGDLPDLEDIDWSPQSKYVLQQAVTGFQDFAAIITSLAMRKPGTYVPERILPHQVFVIQCIVDAFTVSRGWSIDMLKGHVLMNPPQSFNPTREIELFLDREKERNSSGCMRALWQLSELLYADETIRMQPGYHDNWFKSAQGLDCVWGCLGRSAHLHEQLMFPDSAFSGTHANGLWELSPFLCGVGLMNSVELAYRYSMSIWDNLVMVSAMFHLYNMLVKAGYLTIPNQLYHSLQDSFKDCIFQNGEAPTYNFGRCLTRRVNDLWGTGRQGQKNARCLTASRTQGIYGGLDPSLNVSFKKKSNLLLYRDANWDIESIPDSDIEPRSSLAMLRIFQAKQVTDSQTGEKTLEETDLIRRAKAELKVDNDELLGMAILGIASAPIGVEPASHAGTRLTGEKLLRLVKKDIYNDVCGDSPSSGINYLGVAASVLFHHDSIERELLRLENPRFLEVYLSNDPDRRLFSLNHIMNLRDEACLQAMAGVMETFRTSLKDFVYWEDMGRAADMPDRSSAEKPTDKQCSVM
ncbi:uncharacterized protein GLRG_03927 [Colletotrichum graminicola M1.001]|uniref:DUF6604 domain-containing protein n=1 Tax=Colletotrichum graminicola (strain M1.001 / M2 / FGSC 10212) TaxID=645133 RepID=E3QD11_COLGM|nr:uncharacterized protein GLRG_03927 [Colletotrichum graminicola M1.001]EFQ28783.1 hypothetical protein GLRG_03927 [Colletotrichum graminicola M1.001]